MARTYPLIWDHLNAVVTYLDSQLVFPISHWEAPTDDADGEKYHDPPYAMVRLFPSAEEFDGPLDDSQADIILRLQIMGVGENDEQALRILDTIRPLMQRRNITIPNRFVMDLRLMVTAGGVSRENAIPSPLLYAQDLYLLQTTPS